MDKLLGDKLFTDVKDTGHKKIFAGVNDTGD
jgi:hypothetical protein